MYCLQCIWKLFNWLVRREEDANGNGSQRNKGVTDRRREANCSWDICVCGILPESAQFRLGNTGIYWKYIVMKNENKSFLSDNQADSETGCWMAVCGVLPWRAEHRQHEYSGTNHWLWPFWIYGQVSVASLFGMCMCSCCVGQSWCLWLL